MNAIRVIADVLKKSKQIEFAYLFGSRATGSEAESSDWDIAVFYGGSLKASRWGRFYLEAELSRMLGAEVQITVLNELRSPLLLFEVFSKGTLLFERTRERRLIYETRGIAAYHDWLYFQDRYIATG